jgi:tetratricopeptide (TPR) repeat protein
VPFLEQVALAFLAATPAFALQGNPASTVTTEYVDSKLCAGCHREIAENYAKTGMAGSFAQVVTREGAGKFGEIPEYYHAISDSYYSMQVRDGQLFQRRWQLDRTKDPINVEDVSVDYVMGSGNHARSFLHRTLAGMLIELPLGWYPKNGGEWAMVPGSDTAHPQTRRFISYKCMFCHNGYPRIPAANEAPGSDPVFLELPNGIDCQRCHGPGGEHVRTSGAGKIVNPAKLDRDRRMEVCMQCHLETTSGRIPADLQRFDRGAFSYIPGQPLGDFAIQFDHAPGTGHDGKFEAVSSVYRLRQSRCFLESGGKLECASCHDPHRILRGEEAVKHYSAVCQQCHSAAAHPAAAEVTKDDCIGCHMPKRRVDDAPHVIMTDHKIARLAPANALTPFAERSAEAYRGEVVPYYPSPLPDTPLHSLYRAVAQVGLGNNLEAGMPELVKWIGKVKPKEPEFYMVLGDGWKNLGKPEQASAAYRQALTLTPNSTRAMRALAAADTDHAKEILAHAVEIASNDAESWFRYGVLTSSAESIEKAIAIDPWLPDQSRRLAEITHSVAALNDALSSDPFDGAAWDLGGRIMTEEAQFDAAFFDFERAIRLAPRAAYLYDYALALVRAERFDDAQKNAEAALAADATLAEAHELLGGLWLRKGGSPDAVREYRAALALKPDLPRLHLRLGTALAAHGEKDGAAAQLRLAASGADAEIARQAAAALRDLGIEK